MSTAARTMTSAVDSPKRTAVVLDPHPVLLDAVQEVLARADVEVVGKTTSLEQALALAEEREPDVLVTEITLEGDGMDAIECVREARRRVPELRPIVFSLSDDPQLIEAAFEAGAAAYVVKTVHPDDLALAIRQTFDHSVYLPGNTLRPTPPRSEPVEEVEELTRREVEILKLVSEGSANADVARMLWVTEHTVKFHLSNIYRKLRVANRTEASRWAQRRGLLPDAAATNGSGP